MELRKSIDKFLIEKYGAVKPEWELVITLLMDNVELYKECKKSLKENGIYNKDTGAKNPLLITLRDTQVQIIKVIQQLGLSPYANSRIKDVIDNDDDFINGLTD